MELLMKFQTDSEKETEAVGEKLGRLLKPGDIVTLNGELGAGKTCFTSGAAKALGIRDYITSPTFTIVNEYRSGESLLYHFDLYRIASYEELLDIMTPCCSSNGRNACRKSKNITSRELRMSGSRGVMIFRRRGVKSRSGGMRNEASCAGYVL